MTDLLFTFEIAQDLFNSEEQFPVDLDDAWVWLEYSTKQKALDKLVRNFEPGTDFNQKVDTQQGISGRATIKYSLSIDCFKQIGMMARSEKGKQVRQYFLQCEKAAKEFVKAHRELAIAAQMCRRLTTDYQELANLSTFYANEFVQSIDLNITPVVSQNDLSASLTANRLGLAFNKQIKAVELLSDSFSPESYLTLKEEFYTLASAHNDLLKTKTPQPEIVTEYRDREVEVIKEVESYECSQCRMDLHNAKNIEKGLRRVIKDLEADVLALETSAKLQRDSITISRLALPPGK